MNFQNIIFEVVGSTAYITINLPDKRNPVNNTTKAELLEAFDACDFNDEIRAVVLRGAGGVFSAGGDLAAMKARIDAGERGTRISCRLGAEMNLRLRNIKKPTIAYVEGAVAGSGMCLALSCDFQIVSEDAKMSFSFVNIGYVPDSGATYLVTRAVGTVRATELLMSGRRFTGREAADMGLVTLAVPHSEMEAKLTEYIEKYSNGPTTAYGFIKTMINRASFAAYADGMESEIEYQGICEQTDDFKNAVTSFFEKKKPSFTGK